MIPNEIMEFRFCALETLREIVGRKRLKSIRQKNLKWKQRVQAFKFLYSLVQMSWWKSNTVKSLQHFFHNIVCFSQQMLVYCPHQRISAKDVLTHPYFTDLDKTTLPARNFKPMEMMYDWCACLKWTAKFFICEIFLVYNLKLLWLDWSLLPLKLPSSESCSVINFFITRVFEFLFDSSVYFSCSLSLSLSLSLSHLPLCFCFQNSIGHVL